MSESSVTFQAYPYRAYWQPKQDTATGFIFQALDRSGYDQAARVPPAPQTFRTIVLENPYLRVVVLPDLGGRLFQITNKPTGQNLLYNNRVLKPTHWGPDNQGGWLAAGGIEWALPVQEHGYEWGIPWQSAVTQDEAGISVTLTDSTSNDRVRARIRITLPAEAAYVEIRPRLENPTGRAVRLQFWLNAQLTLGANKNVSPGTEFVIPASSVLVHSTGNAFIPGGNVPLARRAAAPLDWPIVAGRDLSRYANWENYLGIFAAPERPFVGAYNHDTGLGVARIFPWEQAPHVKLFAFGPRFCCRQEIADDDSDYFELWGGLPRTFFPDDDVTLGPGEAREWAEYWVPFARTGGLTAASRDAVLFLRREGNSMQIAAYSAVPRAATLVLQGVETRRWEVSLAPGAPFTARAPAEPGKLRLQLVEAGRVLLEAAEQ